MNELFTFENENDLHVVEISNIFMRKCYFKKKGLYSKCAPYQRLAKRPNTDLFEFSKFHGEKKTVCKYCKEY